MQDDLVGLGPVNLGLGHDQAIEDLDRAGADPIGQRRLLDPRAHRSGGAPAPGSRVHVEVRCDEARPLRPVDIDPDVSEPEGQDGIVEGGARSAGVEQSGQEHVAGEPTDRIHVRDAGHDARTSARRAIRAATDPAPKPSSIPTTARPSAHEHNIAFSAVWPPCAEP